MRLFAAGERDRILSKLALRLRNREPEGIADAYDLYGSILFLLIKGIVKEEKPADTLLQECFLRAWKRVEQLEDDEDVGVWLAGIARECASDFSASSIRRAKVKSINSTKPFPSDALREFPSWADQAQIEDGFLMLSSDEKRVTDLSFYKGLSHPAIADELREPIKEVERLARGGRSRLSLTLHAYLVDLIVKTRKEM